jgi:hypothetical protein
MSAPFLSTLIITVIIDPTDRPAEEKKDMAGFPFLETILEEEGEVIYVMLQSRHYSCSAKKKKKLLVCLLASFFQDKGALCGCSCFL